MEDTDEMRKDSPIEPLWLDQAMDVHQALSKGLRNIVIVAMLVSLLAMCGMAALMWGYGSRKLVVRGILFGLWFGPFCGAVLWVFLRPSDMVDVRLIKLPGCAAMVAGVSMGPRWFIQDVRHWRHLTSSLRANRNHTVVASYLHENHFNVMNLLFLALTLYLSATILLLFVV